MSDLIKENFEKICNEAQSKSQKVELLIQESERLTLGAQKGELQKFESSLSRTAGFRVFANGHWGFAYTENLSSDSLMNTFHEAASNAQLMNTGKSHDLGVLSEPQSTLDLQLYKPETIPLDEKIKLAYNLESEFLKIDSRIKNVPYSGYNEVTNLVRVLNSNGVDKTFKQNYYTASTYGLAKENEISKTDGDYMVVRNYNELQVDKICQNAAKKVLSKLNPKPLKTGKYPVIIISDEFTTVLTMISSYFSAKEVFEKKSLLCDRLHKTIASTKVNLTDDPLNTHGTGVRPFDSEGSPSKKTNLIENGVLKNYLTDINYSQKMNLPLTANSARNPTSTSDIAPSNLVLEKGTSTLESLLKKHSRVVLLTNFTGGLHAGFKESTGDFSMPAEGFLYENGINQGPIDQFIVSGNVLELFEKIEDLGNEYNSHGGNKICPDVLISSLSFAGEN